MSLRLQLYPEFIFIDAVRTIMDLYPDLYNVFMRIARKAGWEPDPAQFHEAYNAEYVKVAERLVGKTDFSIDQTRERDFWRGIDAAIFHRLGLKDECEELANEFFDEFESGIHWRLYDETLPTLHRLREMGIRVGIISNGTEGMHQYMERCEIRPLVEFVLVSASVGWEKPGAEIFHLALKKAGVPAAKCLHVGDSYDHDVVGARNVGITPVWIRRDSKAELDGCVTINHLGDLVDLLEGVKPCPAKI